MQLGLLQLSKAFEHFSLIPLQSFPKVVSVPCQAVGLMRDEYVSSEVELGMLYYFLKANSALIFLRFNKLMIAIGINKSGKMVVVENPFFE
jgi:hypothetical protein